MLLKFARATNSKGRKQQTLKENLLYLIFETIHNLKVKMLRQTFRKAEKRQVVGKEMFAQISKMKTMCQSNEEKMHENKDGAS